MIGQSHGFTLVLEMQVRSRLPETARLPSSELCTREDEWVLLCGRGVLNIHLQPFAILIGYFQFAAGSSALLPKCLTLQLCIGCLLHLCAWAKIVSQPWDVRGVGQLLTGGSRCPRDLVVWPRVCRMGPIPTTCVSWLPSAPGTAHRRVMCSTRHGV